MNKQLATKSGGFSPLLIIPFVIMFLFYLPTLYELVRDWATDGNYSHGFLIPAVSVYLIWQKKKELAALTFTTDNRGLFFVVAGLILFILGNGAAEYFTVRFSFVVTLFGLVYYLFGHQLVRKTWFEFFFLLFMIPIPYVIYFAATFPMQLLASKITAGVLNLIGMGVVRQGNIIHISGYSLEVAEACSGMRSLVSLLALGALFAYLTQKRFTAQLILFLSTIPIAVAANVFRVFITSLLAYTVTENVTAEPLHSILGLSVFAVAFILLFILGLILKQVFK
ncbi:MAG: exosortase/archaeosortase family protein [candidate division Zixibacteria bacterium]|nr:exosortase/archaeosortase family protein [candidate division Zixibacteria bacterium]